jgi:hypothetical protein
MNKFQPEAPSGSPLTTAEAGAGLDPTLTRTGKLSRLIDWLGSARRINTDINDEMATLKFEVEVLRWANKELRAELTAAKPLIAYALKRKASLAAYELKRGR